MCGYIRFKTSRIFHSQEFGGNLDSETAVSQDLNLPITARFIRFLPKAWNNGISMRVELYGCEGTTIYSSLIMFTQGKYSLSP